MVLCQILIGFMDGEFFKGNGFSSNALLVVREPSVNKRKKKIIKSQLLERLFTVFVSNVFAYMTAGSNAFACMTAGSNALLA